MSSTGKTQWKQFQGLPSTNLIYLSVPLLTKALFIHILYSLFPQRTLRSKHYQYHFHFIANVLRNRNQVAKGIQSFPLQEIKEDLMSMLPEAFSKLRWEENWKALLIRKPDLLKSLLCSQIFYLPQPMSGIST